MVDISNISESKLDRALRLTCVEFKNSNPSPLVGWVNFRSETTQALYAKHLAAYESWLEENHAGQMQYLYRQLPFRKNPELLFSPLKTVIAFAFPYSSKDFSDPHSPRYAKYMRGIGGSENLISDYHFQIKQEISDFLEKLKIHYDSDSNGISPNTPQHYCSQQNPAPVGESLQWKICVDTSGVLERAWAALCGLGWIGKNTLLIHPQMGSHLLLGVAFLNQCSSREPQIQKNLCGNCTLCLTGCPSKALIAPQRLHAPRCISYLTIEKRGEWDSEETETVNKFPPTLAGCDICQDVCPFNRKKRTSDNLKQNQEGPHLLQEWSVLLNEDEVAYRKRIKGTSLGRIKFKDFQRNLETAYKIHSHCTIKNTPTPIREA